MNDITVPVVLGAILGGVFAFTAGTRDGVGEVRVLAYGLVIAALIYPAWVLASGTTDCLLREMGGLALFGVLAWLGVHASSWWLVAGWAAHVGWDAGFHLDVHTVIPRWYPLVCVGFDLMVAGYLLGRRPQPLWSGHSSSVAGGEKAGTR